MNISPWWLLPVFIAGYFIGLLTKDPFMRDDDE